MHTEHLAYLREIVKRRSMNTASKKLHVAQQTLSTAVKSLEKELDAKLLERTYHGVYPTPIGQEVVDLADEILSKIDYLKLRIAAQKEQNIVGKLDIGIDHGVNLLIMPKVISHFYKFHPNIRVTIQEMSGPQIRTALLEGTIDIGIIPHYDHLSPNLSEPELIHVEIITYTFFARVNKNSPLAQENAISIRALLNYPLALYELGTSSGQNMLNNLKKYGEPRILPTHYPSVAQQLVSDNLAVSIAVKANNYMPLMFSDYGNTIVTIPLKEQFPFYASYVIHRNHLNNPIIDKFVDVLTKLT